MNDRRFFLEYINDRVGNGTRIVDVEGDPVEDTLCVVLDRGHGPRPNSQKTINWKNLSKCREIQERFESTLKNKLVTEAELVEKSENYEVFKVVLVALTGGRGIANRPRPHFVGIATKCDAFCIGKSVRGAKSGLTSRIMKQIVQKLED